MDNSKFQVYEESCKMIKAVIQTFLNNLRIQIYGVHFIEWGDFNDGIKLDDGPQNSVLVLIMVLDENLLRLKISNDETWDNLTNLINILGYKHKTDNDLYLKIYK